MDAVQKSGAWYAYKGEKIGQGEEECENILKENILRDYGRSRSSGKENTITSCRYS